MFGIEFDVFANQEFNDPNDNHVGINFNSLTSTVIGDAGFWSDGGDGGSDFNRVRLNSGENYQVWIDYSDFVMNVTMAPAGMKKPRRPLINTSLNLSEIFIDEMFMGFTSATGKLVQGHHILGWSFSNTNFSLSESLITTGLPSFVLPKDPITKSKWFIAGVTAGGFLVVCFIATILWVLIADLRRKARARAEMEDWELEYWPHRITYQKIESATNGFAEENVIGIGGSGKVYKGVLAGEGNSEVAVKRISHENDGMREFLAEISSIGRLKHRNLVSLKGWCKKEKGNFLLLYDYMENGSLDKWVFDCEEKNMLSCDDRIKILKNVALGVLYLHEGWESKVLHRDIKASNVLLDKDMNGRLGDFGLARVHSHGQVATTTRIVGTMGYIAPELIRTGRASTQSDVFGFGVLILEVMCGRRPIEDGKPSLVDWVRRLVVEGELATILDERLRKKGGWSEEEVERVLHLGLLCAHPDPNARPTMRQIVKVLEGKIELDENESESMNAYLLQRLKSKEMWSDSNVGFGHKLHPTFEDFLQSSSTSISWSTSIANGR